MIEAREIELNGRTTVGDLFKLIDMPYRVTNKARVEVKQDFDARGLQKTTTLRVEWDSKK